MLSTSDELSKFYILVLFAGLFHLMNHAVLNVHYLWALVSLITSPEHVIFVC